MRKALPAMMQRFDDAMAVMADALNEVGDLGESLNRIVHSAVQTVPGADHASVTVKHCDGRLETSAGTNPVVFKADELQYELLEGPCYDAVTSDTVTYSRDLAADTEWPRFGPRAAELGFRSQMALRLGDVGGRVTGLNLYSETYSAFEDDQGLPQLFASHAKVALGYATKLQTLSGALNTRETIGKAIGIAMERYDLSDERAFEFLIRVSQTSNTKLHIIAQALVDAGTKPPNA